MDRDHQIQLVRGLEAIRREQASPDGSHAGYKSALVGFVVCAILLPSTVSGAIIAGWHWPHLILWLVPIGLAISQCVLVTIIVKYHINKRTRILYEALLSEGASQSSPEE